MTPTWGDGTISVTEGRFLRTFCLGQPLRGVPVIGKLNGDRFWSLERPFSQRTVCRNFPISFVCSQFYPYRTTRTIIFQRRSAPILQDYNTTLPSVRAIHPCRTHNSVQPLRFHGGTRRWRTCPSASSFPNLLTSSYIVANVIALRVYPDDPTNDNEDYYLGPRVVRVAKVLRADGTYIVAMCIILFYS